MIDFHIVPRDFPIPGEGILGSDFFTESKSKINFKDNTITINALKLKFSFFSSDTLPDDIYSISNKYDLLVPEIQAPSSLCVSTYTQNFDKESIDPSKEEEIPEDLNLDLPIRYAYVCTEAQELEETLGVGGQSITSSLTSQTYEVDPGIGNSNQDDDPLSHIKLDHLDAEEREHVIKIVNENKDLFHLPGQILPGTDKVQHRIPTIIDEPVKAGIIQNSSSSYNSPVWCVPKKPGPDGKPRWRLVLDFRDLNSVTNPTDIRSKT